MQNSPWVIELTKISQSCYMNLPGVLDISLELAPYLKAGSYWLREVSRSVTGGHWRSLIRLIQVDQIDQIDKIISSMERLSSQLYVGMGLGWDGWLSQVVGCLRSRHLPSLTFIVKNAEICIVASGALLGLHHFKY